MLIVSANVPQLGVYLTNGSPQLNGGNSVDAEFEVTRPVAGVRCFLRSQSGRIWQDCKNFYILKCNSGVHDSSSIYVPGSSGQWSSSLH